MENFVEIKQDSPSKNHDARKYFRNGYGEEPEPEIAAKSIYIPSLRVQKAVRSNYTSTVDCGDFKDGSVRKYSNTRTFNEDYFDPERDFLGRDDDDDDFERASVTKVQRNATLEQSEVNTNAVENNEWKRRCDEFRVFYNEANQAALSLQEQLDEEKLASKKVEEQNERLLKNMEALQRKFEEVQAESANLRGILDTKNTKISELEKDGDLLRQELQEVKCELEQTTHDKNLSAEYGLALLEEKETLQLKYEEMESKCEVAEIELEQVKEALIKVQKIQKSVIKQSTEREESLLMEIDNKEASYKSIVSKLETELIQARSEVSRVVFEKERIRKENVELYEKCESSESEKNEYKTAVRELKLIETHLSRYNDELQGEKISLLQQNLALRSSQAELETVKNELARMQAESEVNMNQLEELMSLKRNTEKQLEEAMIRLQCEREQKDDLKKQIDEEKNSNKILNEKLALLNIQSHEYKNKAEEAAKTAVILEEQNKRLSQESEAHRKQVRDLVAAMENERKQEETTIVERQKLELQFKDIAQQLEAAKEVNDDLLRQNQTVKKPLIKVKIKENIEVKAMDCGVTPYTHRSRIVKKPKNTKTKTRNKRKKNEVSEMDTIPFSIVISAGNRTVDSIQECEVIARQKHKQNIDENKREFVLMSKIVSAAEVYAVLYCSRECRVETVPRKVQKKYCRYSGFGKRKFCNFIK